MLTHPFITCLFPMQIWRNTLPCMAIFNVVAAWWMKWTLLSVVWENRHIQPVDLKLALWCGGTKAGNVQCNNDLNTQWWGHLFWTAGNCQAKNAGNKVEKGHNAGLCLGPVPCLFEKYNLERNKTFNISLFFQTMPQKSCELNFISCDGTVE